MTHRPTPSQTVGPFFHNGLLRVPMNVLVTDSTQGHRIRLQGHVLDGDAEPIPDAMVEIWQANSGGRYRHPLDNSTIQLDDTFIGFGRSGTDVDGRYSFETVKPGSIPWSPGGVQAPHLVAHVFARGLLDQLATRIYFADEPTTEDDPVLGQVPPERRSTLLATLEQNNEVPVYRFDIVLQGDKETVFFDL